MKSYKKQNIKFLRNAIKVYSSHRRLKTDIPESFKGILTQLSYDGSKLITTDKEAFRLLSLVEAEK